MRRFPFVLPFLPLFAADGADAPGTACRTIERTFNSLEVACAMPAPPKTSAIEFVARFSGGHDDTLVTIAPRVGEQTAPCEDGSKLRSFGEDGDIELRCTITRAPGDVPAELGVLIRWSHAEYTDHAFATR